MSFSLNKVLTQEKPGGREGEFSFSSILTLWQIVNLVNVFWVYLLFNHFTELSVVQLIISARIKFAKRHFDLVVSQVGTYRHEFLNIKIIFNNNSWTFEKCLFSVARIQFLLTTLLMKIDLVEGLKR